MGGEIERFLHDQGQKTHAPGGGEIEDWLHNSSPNGKLRTSAQLSDPTKPDQAAQIRFLQEKTGLAPDLIGRNVDEVKRQAMLSDFDPDKFSQSFPETARWLSEQPEHVSVALEDMSKLSNIERITKSMKMGFRQGRSESESGDIQFKQLEGQYLSAADRNRLTEIQKDVEKQPGGLGFWSNLVYHSSKMMGQLAHSANDVIGGASLGLGAAGIAAVVQPEIGVPALLGLLATGASTGAAAGLATSTYRSSAGSTYATLKQIKGKNGESIDDGTAQLIASGVGFVSGGLMVGGGEVVTHPFAIAARNLMGAAVKDALVRPTMQMALRDLGMSYAKAVGSGVAVMELQELTNVMGEEVAKMGSAGEFETAMNSPAQRERIIKRLAKAAQEAVTSMALIAAPGALLHGSTTAYRARIAERNMNYFKALGENIENSETYKRLPGGVQRLVEMQTQGTPIEHVYIPAEKWNAYWQEKKADPSDMAERVLGERESLRIATENGGDLQIPTAKYATVLAPTENNKFFAQELRASPLAMSFKEAAEAVKEEAKKAQKKSEPTPTEISAEKVKENITQQLEKAGYDRGTAETYAELYKRAFTRFAEKTGRTPEELFAERPITVTRPEEGATTVQGKHRTLEQEAASLDKRIGELRQQIPEIQEKPMDAHTQFLHDYMLRKTPLEHWSDRDVERVRKRSEDQLRLLGLNDTQIHDAMLVEERGGFKENIKRLFKGAWDPKGRRVLDPQIDYHASVVRRLEVEQALRKIGPLTGEFDQSNLRVFHMDKLAGQGFVGEKLQRLLNFVRMSKADQIREKMKETNLSPSDPAFYTYNSIYNNEAALQHAQAIVKLDKEREFYQGKELPPGFYSKAERLVEEKVPNRVTVADLRNILKDVKAEERKWLGLDQQLKDWERPEHHQLENGKLRKEDIIDWLRANRLNIVEKTAEAQLDRHAMDEFMDEQIGNDATHMSDSIKFEWIGAKLTVTDWGDVPEHMQGRLEPIIEKWAAKQDGEPDYTLGNQLVPEIAEALTDDTDYYAQLENDAMEVAGDFDNSGAYEQYTLPGGENYRELLFTLPEAGHTLVDGEAGGVFRGGHFDEPNVFAHARLKDRVIGAAEDKAERVLFVEEIQSDWHQKGREEGYGDVGLTPDEMERRAELYGRYIEDYNSLTQGERIELNQLNLRSEGSLHSRVPDAPFRNTWHEFVFKRLIREAAEKGYDTIAWTTGDQQNDRYSLEKTVDEIRVFDPDAETKPPEERHVHLEGYRFAPQNEEAEAAGIRRGSYRTFQQTIPLSKLGDYVGKELAVKLMAQEPAKGVEFNTAKNAMLSYLSRSEFPNEVQNRVESGWRPNGGQFEELYELDPEFRHLRDQWDTSQDKQPGWRVLHGEDLKVGGSGMRGFYDDILPRFANQFGKKYKAKVEDVAIKTYPEEEILEFRPKDEEPYWMLGDSDKQYNSREEAEAAMESTVHGLRLTPELKKAALANEFPLYQDARGRIRLGEHGIDIELLKNADPSTFIHETGHLFLDMMHKLKDSSPEIRADYDALRNWMSKKDESDFTREEHELAARGFEKYLAEGRAPTPALQKYYLRFKTWLLSVYKSLTELDVELTDDVRHVFDRMLASKEEVDAEQGRNHPLFKDMKAAGFNPDEARSYTEAVDRSQRAAEEQMTAKIMQNWRNEQSELFLAERRQTEARVREEMFNNPVLRARQVLESGPNKIHEGTVVGRWGEDIASQLKKMTSPDIIESMSPDAAADGLGFSSGDHLIQSLLDSEDPETYVKRRTDAIMRGRQRQQRPMTPAELPSEALKAVHNEKRAQLLRKEMEILSTKEISSAKGMLKRLTRRIPTIEDVRKQATIIIADRAVRSLNSHQFALAEQRAANMAVELYNKGDIQGALEQKQRELLNHELFRAAAGALEFVEKATDYMRRFDKKDVRQRLGKAGANYLSAIDGLRDRFSFADLTEKELSKRVSLRDIIDEAAEQGRDLDIPDEIKNESYRKNYKELKLSELQGVYDTAKQIERLSRVKNKLLAIRWAKNYGELKGKLVEGVRQFFDKDIDRHSNEPVDYTPGFLKRTGRLLNKIDAGHTKMEFLFKYLDGHKANGPFWRSFFKPLQEAENAENARFRGAQKALEDVFAGSYSRAERSQFFWKKYHVKELNTSFTKANLLAIALNQGNEYNKQALAEGHEKFGWKETGIHAALDLLDKRDWDAVQKIWDHIETYWPEIARLEKELTGLEPEKVEVSPVMTKFGEYRGGYYPILFDRDLSERASAIQKEESVKDLFGGGFLYPMTKHGHVKERIGTGGKPLLLTLSPLTNHLANVIHDLSFRRAVIDVNRLISDPEIKTNIEGAVGKEMYGELRPWLVAIARERRGDYANAMEHIISRGRAGATVVHIGWRLTTALVHLPNYFATINQLGVKHAMRGLADVYANPLKIKQAYNFVVNQSPFMKERFETFDRDIRDQMKRLNVDNDFGPMSTITPFVNPRKIHASFFTLIHTAIMGGSLPTWQGGWRKAMDGHVEGIEAGNAEHARDYADSLVREVWSSGSIKDLAPFQRGNETWRAFTMFYTFMSTVYNQMKKEGQQFKLTHDVGKLAAGAMLVWFLPAALSSLITGKAPSTDDDLGEWGKWLARTEAEWPLSTVLLLRDISHPILQGHGDYYPSAAFDVPKEFVKAVQAMEKVATDDHDLTRKEWEEIIDIPGYFLGLPTRQLMLTLTAIYDYLTGEKQVEDLPTDIFHSLVAQAEAPKDKDREVATAPKNDGKSEPVFADLNRA